MTVLAVATLVLGTLLAGCADQADPPEGHDTTATTVGPSEGPSGPGDGDGASPEQTPEATGAAERAVTGLRRQPKGCTLPPLSVDVSGEWEVATLLYAKREKVAPGVSMTLVSPASAGHGDVEVDLVRSADGCTVTATLRDTGHESFAVAGMSLKVSDASADADVPNRARVWVRYRPAK